MGPKCSTVECIVNGEENPKIAPSSWDFVNLPEENRARAIGDMYKKLVKIAPVDPEIWSRIDRH